jgi:phospholipid/cholesterol/gamma-HCH transport system substrate-binding protein
MQRRILELWVGLFVVLGVLALTMLSFKVANLGAIDLSSGYNVRAEFDNIGGLKVKAPVTMAGVRIGRVAEISFDKENFRARVVLNINRRFDNLPQDTSAAILTSGLLGEQYVGLDPGGAPEVLKNGDEIRLTQSAVVLEKLISQFLFSKAEGSSNGSNPAH